VAISSNRSRATLRQTLFIKWVFTNPGRGKGRFVVGLPPAGYQEWKISRRRAHWFSKSTPGNISDRVKFIFTFYPILSILKEII
jgi:hypothetical protein